MNSTPTDKFRSQETILDRLLDADVPTLGAAGILHADESARQHNYKNAYLSWVQRFEASKQSGSETERVRHPLT